MRFIYIVFISVLFINNVLASNILYEKQDSLNYEKYIKHFQDKSDLPIGKLITETALYLKETPYVASTLETGKEEQLVINLREFDCTTFVENCIALSLVLKTNDLSFENYCKYLQMIRYRGGEISDYSSRLHYVTDWIYDNQKKNLLTDISKQLGAITDDKTINFMSINSDKYITLKNDLVQQDKIKHLEQLINQRGYYNYIAKGDIRNVEDQIQDGDIIVFATSINGLDYSHIGIAYHIDEQLKFIHASTKSMKVVIESVSLSEYCLKSSKCTGITVLRLNNKYKR